MDIITNKLDDGIIKHLDELMNLDPGSDRMDSVVKDLVQLHKLRIDEKKLDLEISKAESEVSDKKSRSNLDRKKLFVDIGLGAAELVLPLTLYGVLSYIGFAREFDGVVSSDTLKRVLNSIRSKK